LVLLGSDFAVSQVSNTLAYGVAQLSWFCLGVAKKTPRRASALPQEHQMTSLPSEKERSSCGFHVHHASPLGPKIIAKHVKRIAHLGHRHMAKENAQRLIHSKMQMDALKRRTTYTQDVRFLHSIFLQYSRGSKNIETTL
jgi:hypothetical protein